MTGGYDEGNIQTLTGLEHIRLRPGMYIGRLGDGASPEDGINCHLYPITSLHLEFIDGVVTYLFQHDIDAILW